MLEKIVVWNFINCTASQMLLGRTNPIWWGRASSTYGRDENCIQNYGL